MSQYIAGTVAVTNASAAIVGTDTLWAANVSAGDVFSLAGSGVPYIVGSVTDNTHLTLSSNYAGDTASGQPYMVTTSFTLIFSLPYPEQADIDTATLLKRALLLIDGLLEPTVALPSVRMDTMVLADVLTYLARIHAKNINIGFSAGTYAHGITAVASGYIGGVYSPTQNRIYLVPYAQSNQTNWHFLQEFSQAEISPSLMSGALFNKF